MITLKPIPPIESVKDKDLRRILQIMRENQNTLAANVITKTDLSNANLVTLDGQGNMTAKVAASDALKEQTYKS